jgi:two-component system, chemotaxis family, sensor kinase Cph1
MNRPLTGKYDSDFCGSLPIHLINIIQPYGVLLVIDRQTLSIVQVSENVELLTGVAATNMINKPVTNYLPEKTVALLQQRLTHGTKEKIPMVWKINNHEYLAITHLKEPFYIVEINLNTGTDIDHGSFVDVYQELKHVVTAIENARNVEQTVTIAARELKKASGFDKVMIYRFDKEWNGNVLAEEREDDMESYMGFTFPASDIPQQARDLYLKNTYRFIPDREYQPVKLYPVINPATLAFIDLSDCNLRGVSVVHIEYLKNMQVNASMSTRIIKDEKLWGLIACHHKTSMRMSYKMCAVFELLSGIISAKITSLDKEESHHYSTRLHNIYKKMVEETYRSGNIRAALLNTDANLVKLFNADGCVFMYNGITERKGNVPGRQQVDDLLLWLHTRQFTNIYCTENLSREYDMAAEYRDVASGMLVIPIDAANDGYIILFRPEVAKIINWGGNPQNRMSFEQDMKTYHPRFSFKLWQENVSGVSLPWNDTEINMAETMQKFVQDYTGGKSSFNREKKSPA